MFCTNCGKEIQENSKFCTYCGKQVMDNIAVPVLPDNKPKVHSKKKGIVIAIISILICVSVVIAIVSSIKSPEEILTDNDWYREIYVDCEYYDWSGKEGYYFDAECRKYIFYSDGETEITSYEIGNGGVYGPFSYEITSENIPSSIDWAEEVWENRRPEWEILDDKTLEYEGDHYKWDDEKETHCDCDDNCEHDKTWYITNEYLRIGSYTYTSEKPSSLNTDD